MSRTYSLWLNSRGSTPAMASVVLAVTEQWQLAQAGHCTADWWQPLAAPAAVALDACSPADVELPNTVDHPDEYLGMWHQHRFSPTSFDLLKEFYADWGGRVAIRDWDERLNIQKRNNKQA